MSKVNTGEVEPYPEDHVLGIIDQAADVRAAVEALFAAGYDHEDVTVLCGQRGLELLDADGTRHGSVGRVIRVVQNFGPEREHFRHVQNEQQQGHFAVGVEVADDPGKQQAAGLLREHGGRYLHHYGHREIEALTP